MANTDLAVRVSEVLTREYPNRPESLLLRARFCRLEGRADQAIEFAERAFELDPIYEDAFEFLLAHFERTGQTARIGTICERLISLSSRLSNPRKVRVQTRFAQLCMFLAKYNDAAKHYSDLLSFVTKPEKRTAVNLLVYAFNSAEAARRAKLELPPFIWRNLIQIFEQHPGIDSLPPLAANRYQAMHIPYALAGDMAKAKEYLRKARRAAEAVNNLELIFTVRDYRDVSRDEFCSINDDLMAALERGELWDHTSLPAQQGASLP